jgi:hypothetical protein
MLKLLRQRIRRFFIEAAWCWPVRRVIGPYRPDLFSKARALALAAKLDLSNWLPHSMTQINAVRSDWSILPIGRFLMKSTSKE